MSEMSKNRIGILSDTHGLLREEVLEALKGCRAILHAGDVGGPEILERLSALAPVYAVRGNTDRGWAEPLPETVQVTICGVRFFLIHNRKKIGKLPECNIVLTGHTHRYEERQEDGRLFLNPGSCGPKRFSLPVTMAVLELSETGRQVRRLELSAGASGRSASDTGASGRGASDAGGPGAGKSGPDAGISDADLPLLPEKDLRKLVSDVMRSVDKGYPVKRIAEKYRIGEALAEQICRLYVTHPGVDAEGIINKMGLYPR